MAKSKSGAPAGAQSIEDLQKRHRELDKRKTQAETNLVNAERDLDKLKKEARELYGTDDLVELEKLFEQRTTENERRRAEYQTQLDQIETDLVEVERNFSGTESATEET